MKISGENVELVTNFGQLRAGITVWVKPCHWCSSSGHRGMLIGPLPSALRKSASGAISMGGIGWEVLPRPWCCRAPRRVVDANVVADGLVYRVVDPLHDAKTTERARELVRG